MKDKPSGAQDPSGFEKATPEDRALILEAAKLQMQVLANPASLLNLGYQIALADNPRDFVPAEAVKLAEHVRAVREAERNAPVIHTAEMAGVPPPPGRRPS